MEEKNERTKNTFQNIKHPLIWWFFFFLATWLKFFSNKIFLFTNFCMLIIIRSVCNCFFANSEGGGVCISLFTTGPRSVWQVIRVENRHKFLVYSRIFWKKQIFLKKSKIQLKDQENLFLKNNSVEPYDESMYQIWSR